MRVIFIKFLLFLIQIFKMKKFPEFQQCIENDIQMHMRRNQSKYKENVSMFMNIESCYIHTDEFNGNRDAQNLSVFQEIIRSGPLNVENVKSKKRMDPGNGVWFVLATRTLNCSKNRGTKWNSVYDTVRHFEI